MVPLPLNSGLSLTLNAVRHKKYFPQGNAQRMVKHNNKDLLCLDKNVSAVNLS